MKKIFLIFTVSVLLFANNAKMIKNLIGEQKFKTYHELLKPVLNSTSLEKTIYYLQNNGLLDIFFNKPRIIHPAFIFKNGNPIFNTKTLYDTLHLLGYYYFYPVHIVKKQNYYKITLEMKSAHYIDPLVFINTVSQKGCIVTHISKNNNYTYTLNCANEKISAYGVKNKKIRLLNAKGIYWLNPNGFSKILISSSKYDSWYPYIVFYDSKLDILNIIAKTDQTKTVLLNVPAECKYIKITDNFSKENFKRGIYIKGIQ